MSVLERVKTTENKFCILNGMQKLSCTFYTHVKLPFILGRNTSPTPLYIAYTSQVQCWLIFTAFVMVVLSIIKFLRCCCWWIFVMLACVYKRIKLKGEDFTNIKWVLSFQEHVQKLDCHCKSIPEDDPFRFILFFFCWMFLLDFKLINYLGLFIIYD